MGAWAATGETMMTPLVRRYAVTAPRWPDGFTLRLGVISDIHACEPWMPAERVHAIAQQCNALEPDLVLLLGDFNAGHRLVSGPVMPGAWAEALSVLRAPLGTYAILGNHDWWHGPVPGMPGGAEDVRRALRAIRVEVLENRAVPLSKGGHRFWLAGMLDLMSRGRLAHVERIVADMDATLRQVVDDAPVVMLVHEPNAFRHMSDRVSLTLSGHTHGGQIVLPGMGPIVTPSRRYNYGHIVEDGRQLIVSGGLGESGLPARIGVPPEILEVSVSAAVT
ncbi:metallophosphoesterase [Lichenibacterium dinghuense]|uniref:metallophosphoesterase n=1 Tax=Lichenibacterium dinghuense TaxID=2895977 RepID=UPI001F2DA37C|nr:metallophosphoesterase [Lichenibacterium sp. 6Y81]